MKFSGINLKGLSFYPIVEKELQPCYHKYGADATVTYCTDQIKEDYAGKEILGFKNNFNLHAFITPFYNDQLLLDEINKTELIRYGIYYQTEFWKNPINGVVEAIPDFYKTIWSQLAVDGDLIDQSLVGTTKLVNYPNHGQQLYDLTNGKYGYDVANNIQGQIDVLKPTVEYYQEWFKTKFGKYSSNASYGYGRRQPRYVIKDFFLGIRNSAKDDYWDYNFNHELATDKPISASVNNLTNNLGIERAEAITICNDILENAITNSGWYSDFSHWHTSMDTEYEEYLSNQRSVIGTRDVISLDYGTAVEYQFLRRMVRRIGLYTDGTELVIVTDVKDFEGLPLNQIETTLSVDVDLTGTILEGKEIEGNCDIRKKSANHFVVEVPYSKRDGFNVVRIRESTMPVYLDFTVPVISAIKSGDIITVTTDKPTKIVVYSLPLGADLYNAVVVNRTDTFKTVHEINVSGYDFTGKDIYIGAITENRQSALSIKYNF